MARPYPGQETALRVHTIKIPAPYESQALKKVIARAHSRAQGVVDSMGVQTTGLPGASTGFEGRSFGVAGGMIGLYSQSPANAVQQLPCRFYSTRAGQVEINAEDKLNYDFK